MTSSLEKAQLPSSWSRFKQATNVVSARGQCLLIMSIVSGVKIWKIIFFLTYKFSFGILGTKILFHVVSSEVKLGKQDASLFFIISVIKLKLLFLNYSVMLFLSLWKNIFA